MLEYTEYISAYFRLWCPFFSSILFRTHWT